MRPAALTCPACQAPRDPLEAICGACGLLFSSYAPAGAPPPPGPAPIVCPGCAQLSPAGASVCAACGAALVFSYTALRVGQALSGGRYIIRRVISRGGMGAIYLATDRETFDRAVVVKAMLDYFDPSKPHEVRAAQARFLQEAQTLAALRHPAIPQIFGYFQDGQHNYIVMEYVEGHDLDQGLTHFDDATGQRVAGRPYDREDVLRWGAALCQVLEYLASQPHPVVHHDIKPANLLLDRNSRSVRLVDFGTARARLLIQPGGSVGLQQSSVFGTQGYAAPEQYRGQSEPRSDIYAVAATLYHLATDDDPRQHPFAFPQLGQLSALGDILQDALALQIDRRPTAVMLRRRIELAIQPNAAPVLQAPDGAALDDLPALIRWCEADWWRTDQWLRYGALPDQIERRWGKTRLAEELRTLRRWSSNADSTVDKLLALLDPGGFGRAEPQLAVDVPAIDFGAQPAGEVTLMLTNNGRRYVEVRLDLPTWLDADRLAFELAPGQQVAITLAVKPRGAWARGRRGAVRIHLGSDLQQRYPGIHKPLVAVPVRAPASLWRSLFGRASRGVP